MRNNTVIISSLSYLYYVPATGIQSPIDVALVLVSRGRDETAFFLVIESREKMWSGMRKRGYVAGKIGGEVSGKIWGISSNSKWFRHHCLPVTANATVCKNLSIWQNWFLSACEQFTVCKRNSQDHPLTFDALYRVKNVMKKSVNKVKLVPHQLPLAFFFFCNTPLFYTLLFLHATLTDVGTCFSKCFTY